MSYLAVRRERAPPPARADDNNNNNQYSATLSGFQEVGGLNAETGAILSPAQGTLTLNVDRSNQFINFQLTYSGFTNNVLLAARSRSAGTSSVDHLPARSPRPLPFGDRKAKLRSCWRVQQWASSTTSAPAGWCHRVPARLQARA
jgi:hypothetical protein